MSTHFRRRTSLKCFLQIHFHAFGYVPMANIQHSGFVLFWDTAEKCVNSTPSEKKQSNCFYRSGCNKALWMRAYCGTRSAAFAAIVQV